MNTSSVPHQPSAEGTFSQGPASSHAGPQAEASFSDLSDADERLARDLNALQKIAPIACLFAGFAIGTFPRASAVVLMIILSATAIWCIYAWATCRGNDDIGVSNTQGRDGGAL